MDNLKKNIIRHNRSRGDIRISSSSSYLLLNQDKKNESYKNEIQQFIKDIEDTSKYDCEAWSKYQSTEFGDDLKLKFREYVLSHNGFSLLHLAAKNCRKNFCQFLIKDAKIDKDVTCKIKSTPLHTLIKTNVFSKKDYLNSDDQILKKKICEFKETFDIFIKNNADINYQDENGNSCLHYAVAKANFVAVLLLINVSGISLNIEDKKNLTPLHLACKFGFEDEAELLIDRIDRDKLFNVCMLDLSSSLPPLHLACRNKVEKFKLVKRILEKLHDEDSKLKVQSGILKSNFIDLISKKEDANRQTILEICIENNHVNLVELLLSNYSISTNQPNSVNGNYSIHLAAKNGSTEILSLLIKYNSNIIRNNLADENPLHIAALYNRFKFVREYLVSERHLLINSDYCCLRNQKKTSIDSTHLPCMCNCDGDFDLNSAQLSIRQRDKKFHTPLMRAIVSGSQLVVEELINDKYVELDSKDKNGQSIYHLCSEYNNTDILRYLLQTDFIPQEILFAKDNFENTILHTSCRTGNLEAIKLIVNKLYDSNNSLETMLYAKNYLGHTCFHIACIKGYYNIVEYFLKDKKLIQFLEHVDNNFNTSLHLATENGHSGIANLLLEFGIDPSVKNEENTTALDLSCRLGYFEISKNIITNCSDLKNQDKIQHEFPLHTACYEGAYEVVKLLLLKGVQIDKLNDENKNCLEIAIKQGHREVIRVLLDDPNWKKLIRENNWNEYQPEFDTEESDEDDQSTIIQIVSSQSSQDSKLEKKNLKLIENPELTCLFEHKMWDIFSVILDKCIGEKEIDFSKIDPRTRSMSKHPLMLIARSGQENLLKHDTTRTLLHLKWRVIPRCAFYLNLIIYLIFMLLYSFYSIELSKFGSNQLMKVNSTNQTIQIESVYYLSSPIYFSLLLILFFQILKETFQIFFLDGLSYFLSLQNLIELFTYILAVLSLFSGNYNMQSSYASIAVLFAFIVFPLFTQKLKIFGLYVVAFRRTLANSAKFFPIFLIIFTGFILSFRIRSNFDVTYFNSTSYSLIRTFTMVVGEFDTSRMGLYNDSLPNYIIYFMFIGLMCTIVLNLFVGIAVGEIKTVLDEADIQQTSMRIMFVLKVQSALNLFRNTCLGNCLNMQVTKYSIKEENKFVRIKNQLWKNAKNLLSSNEHTIKLSDPQKRLEDSFNEMFRCTSEQIRSIRFGFSNQIGDCESRLSNSQRRLQDSLTELSNRTNQQIEGLKKETLEANLDLKKSLFETQEELRNWIESLSQSTNFELSDAKQSFNEHMSDSETKIMSLNNKIQNILVSLSKKTNFQFESIKEYSMNTAHQIKSVVINSQKLIDDSIYNLERSNRCFLQSVEEKYLARVERLEQLIGQNFSQPTWDKSVFNELNNNFADTKNMLDTLRDDIVLLNKKCDCFFK